jgi:hypothetical protein
MFAAVMRQRREPGYYLRRELPPGAKPYKEVLHQSVPERAQERVQERAQERAAG